MAETPETDVGEADFVIAGAGPAGAATALLLARAGARVALVERETDFERVFRGEALMPSGVDALSEMGLAPLLDEIPCRALEAWEIFIDGEPVFTVPEPLAELGSRAVRILSQPAFLARLVAEAARQPGFRLHAGASVRELLRGADGRVSGVRLRGAAGARELRAALVVGCDGRASAVRKRAELPLDLSPEHYDVLWFRLPTPAELRGRCAFLMFASRAGQAACYPSWDGALRLALVLRKGGYRERRGADWPEEIAAVTPDWLARHVRAERAALEGPVVLDVVVGRCPRWTAPGVLLLGDAAHPMSPIRAQGINLALRDAIVAANHLVPVLRAGADPAALDAAARAVQAEREPEIVRAQTLQHRDAAGWNSRFAPLLLAFAKAAGRRVGNTGWARRAWLRAQHDLRFGACEVKLRV